MEPAARRGGPLQRFVADVRQMSPGEHLLYWVLPVLFLGTSTVFYFSGVPALVQIVCPARNREWGCLENTQLLLLAGIGWVALRGARSSPERALKAAFAFIGVFTAWVFLEEIDYGAHVNELVAGEKMSALEQLTGVYNLHSQGITDKLYKRSVYGLMAVLFLVAPLLRPGIRNPWLVRLVPTPRIAIIALLAIVSDLVPRGIVAFGLREDGGLGKNIGEFSEVMVYHIFFVYLLQLVHRKEWTLRVRQAV